MGRKILVVFIVLKHLPVFSHTFYSFCVRVSLVATRAHAQIRIFGARHANKFIRKLSIPQIRCNTCELVYILSIM